MKLRHIIQHVNDNHFLLLKQTAELMPLFWSKFHDSPIPKKVLMNVGNQFSITSNMIKSFPLSVYQEILEMHHEHYVAPWVMEKIIPEVFKRVGPDSRDSV